MRYKKKIKKLNNKNEERTQITTEQKVKKYGAITIILKLDFSNPMITSYIKAYATSLL